MQHVDSSSGQCSCRILQVRACYRRLAGATGCDLVTRVCNVQFSLVLKVAFVFHCQASEAPNAEVHMKLMCMHVCCLPDGIGRIVKIYRQVFVK